MKSIRLKEKNFGNFAASSYIEGYLESLGIKPEDISSFLTEPRVKDEESPRDLDNIQKAVDVAYDLMNKGTPVFVVPDSDCDGYTSSSILIAYLKRRWSQADIQWKLHNGKEHGIVLQDIAADRKLIFVPDAGSNDYEQQKELISRGATVIILDHHDIEDDKAFTTGAIVVNNQASKNFINKELSGAGVTLKFIQLMDETYFAAAPIYQDYMDLAATGIIADAMNMTTLDNNFLAWHGLSNIKSEFLAALARKQSRGIKDPTHLTKTDIAFYVAPVINGVVRSGSDEDKQEVFTAMSTENDSRIFTRVWRGKEYQETLYEQAVRLAMNAKNRQDAAKKKSFKWLCNKVRENGWDKHNIVIVTLDANESEKVSPNITGLIAMELVKEFNKPCLVLRKTTFEGKEVYGGSGRNGIFSGLPDLKTTLQQAGALYVVGHPNAHGAFLTAEQVDQVRKYFDEHLNPKDFDLVYDVDYWFHTGEHINKDMLMDIAEYDWLWGNSIPQPKIAFSITVMKNDIRFMGKDQSTVKITTDGVDFIAFGNHELNNLIQQASDNNFIHIDLIGRPSINEWMGNRKLQILIDDFTVFNQKAEEKKIVNLFDLI